MAWVRQTSGGLWQGVYRDAGGRKQTVPAVQSKQLARREAEIAEDKARKRFRGTDPRSPRMRWDDWCAEWEPARQVESSTREGNKPYLSRVHLRWDAVPLGGINSHDLQTWVHGLSRELSASGVRQTFYLLSASLNVAISAGLLEHNPCQGVTLPKHPPGRERFLTDVEVDKIFYHLDGRNRVLAELLLGTGMRLSEACGLHWHRVDLHKGLIRVVETWERPLMKAYPKSSNARTVPVTDAVVEMLVKAADRWPDRGNCGKPHAADESSRARARAADMPEPSSCRSSTVLWMKVTAGEGQYAPMDPHNFTRRAWADALKHAEVPHATPHALRHTYASRLVTAGVPIRRVQKLLGHASVTTTERYAHLADDGYAEVRTALSAHAAVGKQDVWRKPRAV